MYIRKYFLKGNQAIYVKVHGIGTEDKVKWSSSNAISDSIILILFLFYFVKKKCGMLYVCVCVFLCFCFGIESVFFVKLKWKQENFSTMNM